MTEKIKVTQEQADAIERYKRELVNSIDEQFRFGVKRTPHEWAEPLVELGGEQVLDTLRNGYEIKPKFEVKEWLIRIVDNGRNHELGKIFRADKIADDCVYDEEGTQHLKSSCRHATPEEIAEEKQCRWWARHGREVFEFKKGDLINHAGMTLEVEKPEDDLVCIKINESRGILTKELCHQTKVICFAEERKDLE